MQAMSSGSNQVRIIAGRWRSRKLFFPDVRGLRPTPDRIRETLFNWLQPVIAGARCLDLYAGSGALGFEAASRGAARVVLVDSGREVAQSLRDNRKLLCAEQVEIIERDAQHYLAGPSELFDVVFLDPPFVAEGLLEKSLRGLSGSGWLSAGAAIYLEMPVGSTGPSIPEGWKLHKKKKAGQVDYRLYSYRAGSDIP